jgi:hypothetical protein
VGLLKLWGFSKLRDFFVGFFCGTFKIVGFFCETFQIVGFFKILGLFCGTFQIVVFCGTFQIVGFFKIVGQSQCQDCSAGDFGNFAIFAGRLALRRLGRALAAVQAGGLPRRVGEGARRAPQAVDGTCSFCGTFEIVGFFKIEGLFCGIFLWDF